MAKFTAAILAAAAGSAAAFAPSPVAKSTVALNAASLDGMAGGNSVEPMPFRPGSDKSAKMFDPVGFAEVR